MHSGLIVRFKEHQLRNGAAHIVVDLDFLNQARPFDVK